MQVGDEARRRRRASSEGEDIATFELDIDEALQRIKDDGIKDGKTIMLLHYAKLYLLPGIEGPGIGV